MTPLVAEDFASDPRVEKGKQLLLEALLDHQSKISRVLPPQKMRKQTYTEIVDLFANSRGGKLYYPYIGSGMGNGALVELLDGSVKYDFITGIGVQYFGHCHKKIVSTAIDAACKDVVIQGYLQSNQDAVLLSKLLVDASGLDHCFLTSSGVMANENALKVAFQNKFPARRLLAFSHCFAGRTCTFSQVTDKPAYRKGLPSNLFVDYVPFYDPKAPGESTRIAVERLREHLERHPGEYAAMFMELVLGEGGFYPGDENYFKALIEVLQEHSVLVIADEIQSFGRTHSLFAFQHFHLEGLVDIVTIGKLAQVCATLFKKEIAPTAGLLAQTYTSSTSAIHASRAIIEELIHEGYYGKEGKIAKMHAYCEKQLRALSNKHPELIEGPYGIGAMVGFTPLGGDLERITPFLQKLFENGVMAFLAGGKPTRVRFLIPMGVVTFEDVDNVVKILEETLVTCS